MESFGRIILIFGLFMVALGGLLMIGGKLCGLGRLPGDIFIQRGNFSYYFPVVTSIVLSLLLTMLLNLFLRR